MSFTYESIQESGGVKPEVDHLRANLDVVPCSGHGETLYVVGDSSTRLQGLTVTGCRLRWKRGSYPYTAFMRNTNLTKTPRSCRGVLCIVGGDRLCVMENLSPCVSWCSVSYYEWNGDSVMQDGVFTPEFLFFANCFPLDFSTVKAGFTRKRYRFEAENPMDIIFVNIVSSHPSVPAINNCINQVDGCFEMSKDGPDVIGAYDSMPNVQNSRQVLWRGRPRVDVMNTKQQEKNQYLPKNAPECLREPKRCLQDNRHCHTSYVCLSNKWPPPSARG